MIKRRFNPILKPPTPSSFYSQKLLVLITMCFLMTSFEISIDNCGRKLVNSRMWNLITMCRWRDIACDVIRSVSSIAVDSDECIWCHQSRSSHLRWFLSNRSQINSKSLRRAAEGTIRQNRRLRRSSQPLDHFTITIYYLYLLCFDILNMNVDRCIVRYIAHRKDWMIFYPALTIITPSQIELKLCQAIDRILREAIKDIW